MKFSIFNTRLDINSDKSLVYNSLQDKFIVLDKRMAMDFSELKPSEILDKHPTLYKKLLDNKIIVDANIDEFSILKEYSDNILDDESTFLLIVNPTTNCNFNCWYCYETHDKSSKMDLETLERTKKFIKNIIANQAGLEYFSLSFFGGEPLLYFKSVVRPLMEYTKRVCAENNKKPIFGFTTNGYLITEEMAKWFSDFDGVSFQITLDGDREKHNKVRFPAEGVGSYDDIISNIRSLLMNGSSVVLRINYTADNINSLTDVNSHFNDLDQTCKDRLRVSFHRVWQDNQSGNIDNEVFEALENLHQCGLCASESICDEVRQPCYADKKNGALINYNGDIFRCTARDFELAKREGYLNDEGVIIWENNANKKRTEIRLKNEPCTKCRVLPLCGGGCTQKALEFAEKNQSYCFYPTDEEKNKIILDRFYNNYVIKQIKE